MYKEHDLIMLPTKEDDNVLLRKLKQNGNLVFHNFLEHECQHLYVVSNEDIKEGDWFIHKNYVYQCKMGVPLGINPKIIATTDPLITTKEADMSGFYSHYAIPQIPHSFIEFFMKEHNDGRKIEKIEVDYDVAYEEIPRLNTFQDIRFKVIYKGLKINKDNTISINPAKTSWTREEVERISYEAYKAGIQQGMNPDVKPFTDWLKNNL